MRLEPSSAGCSRLTQVGTRHVAKRGGSRHSALQLRDDPELEALVREIIGRVANKWTMFALEVIHEHGRLRFTRLGELIGGISQKMLTKTLRQMEADGLVLRIIYPVVPPRVDLELTERGVSLAAAFCGVLIWAERHREAINRSRKKFALRMNETEFASSR